MKIGIITSGSDSLTLFRFLTKYDHDYVIYYDFSHRPYGDKNFSEASLAVQGGIDFLMKHGVDYIIVPPVYELTLLKSSPRSPAGTSFKKEDTSNKILPLFKTYLLEHCFKYSLVGKIGLLGDYADVEVVESIMKGLEKEYVLTDVQKVIKKFQKPFVHRVKETTLWKYYLIGMSYSNILVNKIIKFDLRYFKDAMVDTVVPLNYGYFNYQNTISKYLNFKKIRFHKLEKLENCFQQLAGSLKSSSADTLEVGSYSVKIFYTGHAEFLKREKRMMRLLQRGKSVEVERQEIESA